MYVLNPFLLRHNRFKCLLDATVLRLRTFYCLNKSIEVAVTKHPKETLVACHVAKVHLRNIVLDIMTRLPLHDFIDDGVQGIILTRQAIR